MFRQTNPALNVSIEEGTENVPGDGRYYVVDRGVIGRNYKSLRDARRNYDQVKAARVAAADEPAPRSEP